VEAVTLAQAAGSDSELSRPHWAAALEHASAAVELRPDDQVAAALRAQAQTALDSLDGIVRVQPVLLKDLGPGTVPRRLVIHGQMIFVLDPVGGWVSRLTMNQTGDRVIDPEDTPIVRKGQSIEDGTVGDLVDFVWVDLAGGRQTSGLLILEHDGALVSYDPAWEGEGGALQLQRSFLGTPPGLPRVVGTYDGRFYVLDTTRNQIRRYEPRGDTYPEQPDYYFVDPPPLADVLDMVIDGHIYLLYADGAISKFLRGNPEPFDVRGLPGNLSQAIALAVDPDSGSGVVYVADRGNGRVVALEQDGNFRAQFYAGEAFDALEALAVDEAMRRMYVISGGRLYVVPLP
jgi:sugar lactone lactonase YvrE